MMPMDDKEIVTTKMTDIAYADASEIKVVNDDVLNLDVSVAKANLELEELNGNLDKLSVTLRENRIRGREARRKMQNIMPHLP